MPLIDDRLVTLAHGNGGQRGRTLIDEVFARRLANPDLDTTLDAARLVLPPGEVLMTTDGFIVQPLEFPGGTIGSLAVHGTVNDLAVSGADPVYLSLAAFIEEGFAIDRLDRIVASMAEAAAENGVRVACGDLKVLPRGEGSGVTFATTGLAVRRIGLQLGIGEVRPGDMVLVSGPVGDHGTAVLLAREQFGLRGDVRSDAGSVLPLTRAVRDLPGMRFMRDPTRGGLATVCHELADASGATVRLEEDRLPIRAPVRGVCEMLGYDPLYLACEGRVVALADPVCAEAVLAAWRALPTGVEAACVGEIAAGPSEVVLATALGGERLLPPLEDDPLPRIC